MTSYGVRRRYGRCGLWMRQHDLGGTDWTLLLPLDEASATYLHDHGMLCCADDAAAESMHPGIVCHGDRIEARLALSRPETTVSAAAMSIDLSEEKTPAFIAELWSSQQP